MRAARANLVMRLLSPRPGAPLDPLAALLTDRHGKIPPPEYCVTPLRRRWTKRLKKYRFFFHLSRYYNASETLRLGGPFV